VVPITVLILVALFLLQARGTGSVGRVFGPIMVAWFVTLSGLGLSAIAERPEVLQAFDPSHAIQLFGREGFRGFQILGSVVLCVTGVEALYADMGHFGRGPIRIGWFSLVMPALLLNYLGQGAATLGDPSLAAAPFFALVPRWALYPMVALATAATVIASQALISGSFSLARQAVQLGYFPRVTVRHTSREHAGQIYVPEVNWMLAALTIALVLQFRTSSALAAAYGIAVTGTLVLTSILFNVVARRRWGWPAAATALLTGLFLVFDLGFFSACTLKLVDGGWVPLAIGGVVFVVMTTWKAGRARLLSHIAGMSLSLEQFLEELGRSPVARVPGAAVFLSANPHGTPPALRHHLKHNHALHEQVVMLSIVSENVPLVASRDRVRVEELGQGFSRVTARFGYMESPNVPALLEVMAIFGVAVDPETVTYYLGRETLLATGKGGMRRWRKALFAFISRNARPATAYFGIPPDRVVELGVQLEL
jgi:KUP system potassium uptake protein